MNKLAIRGEASWLNPTDSVKKFLTESLTEANSSNM
jgi:hypothetical protein